MILRYFLPMHKKANSWQRLFLYRYQYECIFSVLFGGICHLGSPSKKIWKIFKTFAIRVRCSIGSTVQQSSIVTNQQQSILFNCVQQCSKLFKRVQQSSIVFKSVQQYPIMFKVFKSVSKRSIVFNSVQLCSIVFKVV